MGLDNVSKSAIEYSLDLPIPPFNGDEIYDKACDSWAVNEMIMNRTCGLSMYTRITDINPYFLQGCYKAG